MIAVGASELLMLMMLGGGLSNDLVSLLEAQKYFQSRNIPITIDKMVELTRKDPIDGKTQVQQLLALRYLKDNAPEVRKAKDYPDILKLVEAIAQGEKHQDPQGFALGHAQAAAVALGSKIKVTAPTMPEGSAAEAVSWFPKNASIVLAIDARGGPGGLDTSKVAGTYLKKMPEAAREELYKIIEQIGNVHLDRLALAFVAKENQEDSEIYIRITGKADRKRLLAYLGAVMPNIKLTEDRNFRGKPVTRFQSEKNPPAFAIVGDEEVIIAGFKGNNGNHPGLIERTLAIRASKEEGVKDGPLGADVKKVDGKVAGIVVGELPQDMLRGLPFSVKRIKAELHRKEAQLVIKAELWQDTEDEAKKVTEQIKGLRELGLQQLKNPPPLPPDAPVPADIFKTMTKVLEGLKVETTGKSSRVTVSVSQELLQLAPTWFLMGTSVRGEFKQVDPPPQEKK